MKCHDQVRQLIESVGGSVEFGEYTIYADAPRGYTWDSDDVTCIVAQCGNGSGQSWQTEACRELMERARAGLTKCDADRVAEIEYERDEPWTADADAPSEMRPR